RLHTPHVEILTAKTGVGGSRSGLVDDRRIRGHAAAGDALSSRPSTDRSLAGNPADAVCHRRVPGVLRRARADGVHASFDGTLAKDDSWIQRHRGAAAHE